MELSIIIVNYNANKWLKDCITSIVLETTGIKYEIILVDNGSTEPITDLKNQFPQLVIKENIENIGFAGGNNIGTRAATGNYLLFINPDTKIVDGGIQKALTALKRDPTIGTLGPQLRGTDDSIEISCGKRLSLKNKLFPPKANPQHSCFVDWVTGAFLLVPKTVLEKIGGWDESIFLYYEDVEICYRIKKAGYRVFYLNQFCAYHYKGKAVTSGDRKTLRRRGEVFFLQKHFSLLKLPWILLYKFLIWRKEYGKRVLYVVALENIVHNGLYQSQVASLLNRIQGIDLLYIAPVPGILKKVFGKKHGFSILRHAHHIKKSSVSSRIFCIPTMFPTRWFFIKWFILPFYFLSVLPIFLAVLFLNGYKTVHCRSYPACLGAIFIKKCLLKNLRVIFDTRGPYVLESTIIGTFRMHCLSTKVWLKIENILLKNADKTLFVSQENMEYVKSKHGDLHEIEFEIIPTLSVMTSALRENGNSPLLTMVYVGSFWEHYSGDELCSLYVYVRNHVEEKTRLLILTHATFPLDHYIDKYQLSNEEINVMGVSHQEVMDYLSQADLALFPAAFFEGERGNLAKLALSTKLGEYANAGLPVIAPDNMEAICRLLREYQAGGIYRHGQPETLTPPLDKLLSNMRHYSANALKLGQYFSIDKYLPVYKNLWFGNNNILNI